MIYYSHVSMLLIPANLTCQSRGLLIKRILYSIACVNSSMALRQTLPPQTSDVDKNVSFASPFPGGPGLASPKMCILGPAFGLQALATRGIRAFGINLAERLMSAVKRGVYLNTDYSGMGGPEEALRQVVV